MANGLEPGQDGRIFIELINGSFLFEHKGSPAEHGAGLKLAIDRSRLRLDERGTYVELTQFGPIVRLKAKPQGYDAPRLFPGSNKKLGA
jgi:hypothetical protein